MILVVLAATIAWSAGMFGGGYPWAQAPVLVACVVVFVLSLLSPAVGTKRGIPSGLLNSLFIVLAVVVLQVVPLPAFVVTASGAGHGFRQQATSLAPIGEWGTFSLSPAATWEVLGWCVTLGALFVGLLRSLTVGGAVRLAGFVGLCGFLLGLIVLAQGHNELVYGVWRPAGVTVPAGPFVNRNHLAGWTVLALGLTVGLCGRVAAGLSMTVPGVRGMILVMFSSGGSQLLLLLLSIITMCAATFASGSRSGLAAVGVFWCLILAFVLNRVRRDRGFVRASVYAGAVLVLIAASVWAARDHISDQWESGQQSWTSRVAVWGDSVGAMQDFPVTGSGLGTFGFIFSRYRPGSLGDGFQEAHNDYVQLAVEGGVLIVVPLLWFMWWIARTAAKRLGTSEGPEDYWPRAGAICGVAALGVQEIAEFSVRTPAVAVLLVISVATMVSCQADDPLAEA